MTTPLTPGAARKSLGQHFLFDPDILRRIAGLLGPLEGRTVIEVGPGPGGLTRALLGGGAAHLIAIDLDERFVAGLEGWPEAAEGRLRVHRLDALKADERALIADAGGAEPAMILANLPYNVATPLVVKWLKAGAWRGPMALMFQKEVAQRICAVPGDNHYGRLAVISQAASAPYMAMTLKPGAFKPPPKVDSAIVVFQPLPDAARYPDLDALEQLTAAAFGQRRKMLRSALKAFASDRGLDLEQWFASADIDPQRRAETLSQQEFRRLCDLTKKA
jgi:16S rRNA (adenine1518-N6/adenine1519-N6)-dimethyltransferase